MSEAQRNHSGDFGSGAAVVSECEVKGRFGESGCFLRPFFLLFLVLQLPAAAATAQEALRFDHVTAEDGLSGPEVFAIHQDADGFMWFATGEAVDRYDGYSIKSYTSDPRKVGSLSHHYASAFLTDSAGRFWVGTLGGGLNLYLSSEEIFVHFRHRPEEPESLNSDQVLSLLEDPLGGLWVGTDRGLHRLELGAFEPARTKDPPRLTGKERFERVLQDPEDPQRLSGEAVHRLALSTEGALWVGTDGGLDLFEPQSGNVRHFATDSEQYPVSGQEMVADRAVWALCEDAEGNLWFAGSRGLHRLAPTRDVMHHFRHEPKNAQSLNSDRVRDLLVDRQGTLWITTHNGLDVFEPTSGTFRHHVNDVADLHSLGVTPLNGLFEDRTGVLWIGTGDGANRWHPGRAAFKTYRRQTDREPTLAASDVWAVEEDQAGALWIALGLKGLDRLDRAANTVEHFVHDPAMPDSLQNGQISTVYEDRRGDLWVGSMQGGLSRFDPQNRRFDRFRHDAANPFSLSHDDVHRFFEDRTGRFWVCTEGGLNLFDRDSGRFTRFPAAAEDPEVLAYASLIAMVEDEAGWLWLASLDHGLFVLEQGAASFRPIEIAGHREVLSLLADRAGGLWVGTGNGLLRLDRRNQEVTRSYGLEDGLPSTTIRGLQQDSQGHLWIASNHGLSRFDPPSGTFRNYDLHDGLQGVSFSTKADILSPSGEMFFGGWRGLSAFFPDHLRDDPHPPEVVLTDFRLFNHSVLPRSQDPDSPLEKSIRETQTLVLNHRQYVFGFEIAALHYAAPGKNRYAYRLEGLDHNWMITDASQRFVQYTGLRPGTYTFRAKASNKDGVWNEDGIQLKIRVLPPPWLSIWAYTAYTLALLTAAGLYLRTQAAKLRRQRRATEHERAIAERERAVSRRLQTVDKLKDEFLANTSHELRTPLYGITGLAESLMEGATGELPEATKVNLGMIVTSGQRLSHLVNDILDFSKLRHKSLELDLRPVDLRALAEVVLTLSRPLVGQKPVELVNTVPADLSPAQADENRLQQILHNLVGNAIKFTEAGRVEVSASQTGDELEVRVLDTGIGIPEDKQRRIFQAFEQGDASIERKYGGTGLGLAVSRQLVELHGGEIQLRSQPGEGTTFAFTLPVAREPVEHPPTTAVTLPNWARADTATVLDAIPPNLEAYPPHEGSEPVLNSPKRSGEESLKVPQGARILVVDDEPVNLQVLRNYLTIEDFQLTMASSGDDALRLLEEQSFDLVLLDVMMPKMSGYDVCRALRERSTLQHLPVIFLTAKSRDTDVVTGLSLGANDYLSKPISRGELLARVRPHLDLVRINRHLEELVEEKLSQVRVLSGLLPICAGCKKIRDDRGYWDQLEVYIDAHSEAHFSHGICPDCIEENYPEAAKKIDE